MAALLLHFVYTIEGSRQPSVHTIVHTTSRAPPGVCTQLEEDLLRLLAQPRGRGAVADRWDWLLNWNFPAPNNWLEARRVATAAAAAGCSPQPLAAHLHNLKLFITPCLTQCTRPAGAVAAGLCFLRACNATAVRPAWDTLALECGFRRSEGGRPSIPERSPLEPWLHDGICSPLTALWRRAEEGMAAAGEVAQLGMSEYYTVHLKEQGGGGAASDVAMVIGGWRALASDGEHCRTMFDEDCCPRARALGPHPLEVCGGVARGRCLPIEAWMEEQGVEARTPRAAWIRGYAAARCSCAPTFAGSACDGCSAGWQGATCSERRAPEWRRDLVAMRPSERDDFFATVKAAAATSEFKAMEAAHEFGLSLYHETSHLLASHHAYFASLVS